MTPTIETGVLIFAVAGFAVKELWSLSVGANRRLMEEVLKLKEELQKHSLVCLELSLGVESLREKVAEIPKLKQDVNVAHERIRNLMQSHGREILVPSS